MAEEKPDNLPMLTKQEIRSEKRSLVEMAKEERLNYLQSQVHLYEKSLEPTNEQVIGNILGALSTGLGVELPSIEAMRHFYGPELSRYPKDIIEDAAKEILRSYVYPRFPPIAEFCKRADEMLLERQNLAREWERSLEWERNGPVIIKRTSAAQNGPKRLSASLPKIKHS